MNEMENDLDDFFTMEDINKINSIIRETLKGME